MSVPGESTWSHGPRETQRHLLACIIRNAVSSSSSMRHPPFQTSYGKQLKERSRTLIQRLYGVFLATQHGIPDVFVSASLARDMQELGSLSKSIPVKYRSPIKTNSTRGSMPTARTRTSY